VQQQRGQSAASNFLAAGIGRCKKGVPQKRAPVAGRGSTSRAAPMAGTTCAPYARALRRLRTFPSSERPSRTARQALRAASVHFGWHPARVMPSPRNASSRGRRAPALAAHRACRRRSAPSPFRDAARPQPSRHRPTTVPSASRSSRAVSLPADLGEAAFDGLIEAADRSERLATARPW